MIGPSRWLEAELTRGATSMRLRIGFISGLAVGYYLGAMAGRERYEQINRFLRTVQGSDAMEGAAGKARAVVDLGKERARDVVTSKAGDGSNAEGANHKGTDTLI